MASDSTVTRDRLVKRLRVPGVAGVSDAKRAKQLIEQAKLAYDTAVGATEEQARRTERELGALGRLEIAAYDEELRRFVTAFSRIKHKQHLSDFDGLAAFVPGDVDLVQFEQLDFSGIAAAKAAIAGGGAGTVAGMASFAAVGSFATASTGTAIGSLSGAAATHATLAWLGGGAVAAGGGGMAAGAAVLGGVVALPVVAVGALVFDRQATKTLEKARAKQAAAQAAISRTRVLRAALVAIEEFAKDLRRLVVALRDELRSRLVWLDALVANNSDYRSYNDGIREQVMLAAAVAVTLRHVIDAPLLGHDGALSPDAPELLMTGEQLLSLL